ncbi:type II toxin-antitoxin system mRNA interferase toxin, RelE/StbE family [Candidatus Daviesbacteria bacterium]|nr:type II toxin-antitoxin system mRNA interferase toxin, RelE/StbE family [Candidatus Daviesbacteria bacterium]
MIISKTSAFKKKFQKLSQKIKEKFAERILLFEKDQFDSTLNNHALKGSYSGYRSINITGDIRAIYKKTNDEAIFIAIDSHSNLYG